VIYSWFSIGLDIFLVLDHPFNSLQNFFSELLEQDFFVAGCPLLAPNQQRQSTEGLQNMLMSSLCNNYLFSVCKNVIVCS